MIRQRPAARCLAAASIAVTLVVSGVGPVAAAPVPAPPAIAPFDVAGVLQAATLDATCTTDPHCGGTLTVDDRVVIVPRETVVFLPTRALTWQELFAGAPRSHAPGQTGLALADSPAPVFPHTVHVVGNKVGNTDIAGLIDISQGGPARGSGYIDAIDYSTGELRIVATNGADEPGTRVRLNDPSGQFGRAQSSDVRFTVDAGASSVAAATGFPMCIPRSDPTVTDDPRCPQANRPADFTGGFAKTIQMNDPGTRPGIFPDATRQVPMEVGDRVTFAGTLVADAAGTYVSAHTVRNAAAIYTWPGTSPVYVTVDAGLSGPRGLTVVGAHQAAARTRFEGMTTDPSRAIHLYGINVDPATGDESERDWGAFGVDQGPPTGVSKGRWRSREPCLVPFGSLSTRPDAQCTSGPDGRFTPPTREVRVAVEGRGPQDRADPTPTAADGIGSGQIRIPIREFVLPDGARGGRPAAVAFESLPFLACGGFTSAGGTMVGRLDPWPGATPPTCPGHTTVAACMSPVVSAGGPYTVNSGATVSLDGSASGTPRPTLKWATPTTGTIVDVTLGTTMYRAPAVVATTTVNLSLAARNDCGGSSTATSTITVTAALPPTVGEIPAISVVSGATATLTVPGLEHNGTAPAPLVFTAAQRGDPALRNLTVTQVPPAGARLTFTAPTLPPDQVDSSTVTITIKAANSLGQLSAGRAVTVTVVPAPDRVTITGATYRTGPRQLVVTARSSAAAPAVELTLLPYLTRTGSTFTPPDGSLVNLGNGQFTLTLAGVPRPAAGKSLRVVSNLGGRSPAHAVKRVGA